MSNICLAVKNRKVERKGKLSIEYYIDNKPIKYCYGYISKDNESLIDECKECKIYVGFAEQNLKKESN